MKQESLEAVGRKEMQTSNPRNLESIVIDSHTNAVKCRRAHVKAEESVTY